MISEQHQQQAAADDAAGGEQDEPRDLHWGGGGEGRGSVKRCGYWQGDDATGGEQMISRARKGGEWGEAPRCGEGANLPTSTVLYDCASPPSTFSPSTNDANTTLETNCTQPSAAKMDWAANAAGRRGGGGG